MINTLRINGEELSGIYIDSSLSFNKPAKSVNTFTVPGRSGALVIDEGTYENVTITYPAYFRATQGIAFPQAFKRLLDRLAPLSGYQRIEEARDPEHFRLGRVIIPQTPNVVRLNRNGFFDLAFDCKPQRYLTAGEVQADFTADSSIYNPTAYAARPLIRIYGNGTTTVGNTQFTTANNADNYIDIDCEMMDCYRGAANMNASVTFTGTDFPALEPGDNQILLGTGISRVEITPRWWEL